MTDLRHSDRAFASSDLQSSDTAFSAGCARITYYVREVSDTVLSRHDAHSIVRHEVDTIEEAQELLTDLQEELYGTGSYAYITRD